MLYYSTNKALRTIESIREDNRKKYIRQMNEWNELSQVVLDNWDELFFNACLISGQTESLGIEVHPVDEDYYAPERIWVYFKHPQKGYIHSVELHRSVGVKYIDDIRCYNTFDKKFKPKQIIGVNLEVAKRVLCILGMKREII